jgi:hypothetical protein
MNKLKAMFTKAQNQIHNLWQHTKLLKQKSQRKKLKLDLKYRLFVMERRWQLHPLFGKTYPKPGLMRRILAGILAFVIVGTGFFTYLNVQANANWYSGNWPYRKMITIDHTKVSNTTQTNFPVLVSITDSNLATFAQSNGGDIVFTSADGTTKLSHEIESYTSATGALIAWVQVPSLSASVDTQIYIYYGNRTAINQQNVSGTWDSNYLLVQHLKESAACPVSFMDSTSYLHTGS